MILAGDIGGTKTNLAWVSQTGDSLHLNVTKSYHSQKFTTLQEVIDAFMGEFPETVTRAAFGIAGPVVNGRSRLTNLGWDVDGQEVARGLSLGSVGLLNDLAATAYGTLRLKETERIVLKPGSSQPGGTIAVIAAGTGLGEGGLVWDGTRYIALPSEGGHTDFGPRNDDEMDLLRFLLNEFDRVSYERVACGPGLHNIYRFLRDRSGAPEPSWLTEAMAAGDPSAAISRAGVEQKDNVCEKSLAMFVSSYGAEAGNLALKLLATGGVYVGGGIAPKILPQLQDGSFVRSFVRKGRYESLMHAIPVYVILNDQTALLGAAHFALMSGD